MGRVQLRQLRRRYGRRAPPADRMLLLGRWRLQLHRPGHELRLSHDAVGLRAELRWKLAGILVFCNYELLDIHGQDWRCASCRSDSRQYTMIIGILIVSQK